MKKDRNCNCGSPYPVYPAYQGMPYMQNMPMMGPVPFGMNNNQTTNQMMNNSMMNFTDQSLNNIQEQINMLDKRVSNLENMLNTSNISNNQYSSSNYQMM